MPELPLLLPDWPASVKVRAAMSTRQGGVSAGPYASLNLGERAGDDPAHVLENRRRLREVLELRQEPVWLKQVHGTNVVHLTLQTIQEKIPSPPESGERRRGMLAGVRGLVEHGTPLTPAPASTARRPQEGRGGNSPEADASFTTEPGVVCAVQAADCLPVLFCDDAGTVVAAAHAGWRGLAAGILEATVRALPARPSALMAWLGAAIGPQSFEVGAEVREAFVNRDPQAAACFKKKYPLSPGHGGEAARHARRGEGDPDKYLADLYGLARQRLATADVTRVFGGGLCTFRETERFFSYRRDGQCGRMAALIWLE